MCKKDVPKHIGLEKFIEDSKQNFESEVFVPSTYSLTLSEYPREQSGYSLRLLLSGRLYRLDGKQENGHLTLAIPDDQLNDIAIELIRLLDRREKHLISLLKEFLGNG